MTITLSAKQMTVNDGKEVVPFEEKQRTTVAMLMKQKLGLPVE